MYKVIITLLFVNYLLVDASDRIAPTSCLESKFPTVTSWIQACKKMPKNRDKQIKVNFSLHSPFFQTIENFLNKIIDPVKGIQARQESFKEFSYILDLWKKIIATGPLSQENLWSISNTGKKIPDKAFYDIKKLSQSDEFQPYVQKLVAKSDDQFYVHGDLHGDMHSLIAELEYLLQQGIIDDNFRIISNNIWFVFLGDYVDRGKYGCEVIYTLLRLSLANPDRVILVRGNHEELQICDHYGFKQEVLQKSGDKNIYFSIASMYDLLPVALYLGTKNIEKNIINYIQCCHGGLEVGYDPKIFLDDTKTSYQLLGNLYCPEILTKSDEFLLHIKPSYALNSMYNAHKNKHKGFNENYMPVDTLGLGFVWTDFNVNDTALVLYNHGRGFTYGSFATKAVLDAQSTEHSKIRGIIRAHQHSDDMMPHLIANKGVFKMWRSDEIGLFRMFQDGLVWTFNVSPDSVYGDHYKYNFHTFAKVTVQKNYDDWKMQIFNINV